MFQAMGSFLYGTLILAAINIIFQTQSAASQFIWQNGKRECFDSFGFPKRCSDGPSLDPWVPAPQRTEPLRIVSPIEVGRESGKSNFYTCYPKNPNDRCKKYHHFEKMKKVNYYKAKQECAAIGMQLVSIENPDKWEDVVNGISSVGKGYFWTSGKRIEKTEKFEWGNGCPFGFTEWDKKQPDNFLYRGENCVHIRPNLKWNDESCGGMWSKKMGYICESVECKKV